MLKSDIVPLPPFFERYIVPVQEEHLIDALRHALEELENWDLAYWEPLRHHRYEEGKWTVAEVLQHVLDNERIQSYRALRFARMDATVLPGYDENVLAKHCQANERSLLSIWEELVLLRKSNILFFASLPKEQYLFCGTAFQVKINSLALGFVLVGHQRHHLDVLEKRYRI
ncbi:MAG: DinB family protein [Cytophagaceae bacterium]|jgi:hypothetical protein|nr:DinB family protein [Cytophagaceae bacterium]